MEHRALWNPEIVAGPRLASALSIAVLSFLGFVTISYVLINAGTQAQLAGLVRLGIGLAIWGFNRACGKTMIISGDMSGLVEESV